MNRLPDDEEYRRDTLDLDAFRQRQYEREQPDRLIGLCCPHCTRDNRDTLDLAGRYLDFYLRSGLPTKAASFALVAWGLSLLAATARFLYEWALDISLTIQRGGPVLPFGGPL